MSFEIEQKFRTDDHERVADMLVAMGAEGGGVSIEQADAYLSHPSRDFSQSGEALRLRRSGDLNAITYKGPKFGGPTKTRKELEVEFEPGPKAYDAMFGLFSDLGFRPVAIVKKTRTPYCLVVDGHPIEVVLDKVDGLGTFVEVEAIAKDEDGVRGAQEAVIGLAKALGLGTVEPRSYLRMVLESVATAAES